LNLVEAGRWKANVGMYAWCTNFVNLVNYPKRNHRFNGADNDLLRARFRHLAWPKLKLLSKNLTN
jgi:hypothetical protein